MAKCRETLAAQEDRRQRSVQKGAPCADSNQMPAANLSVGKHPQGVSKAKAERPSRRSARLIPECSEHTKRQHSLLANKTPYKEGRLTASLSKDRKRSREVENQLDDHLTVPLRKRPRTSPDFTVERPSDQETSFCSRSTQIDPIDYWLKEQTWPKEYFEPDPMSYLLARRKSTPSLRRKRSESGSLAAGSSTPSDQKPREEKTAPYQDPRYKILLETKGSFMRNYALATRSATLECLIESVNEGWNNAIPLTGTRPQPDYAVGFRREAFTVDQLDKLQPFIGDFIAGDQSFFMATYYMYFPFLTCEVKCGAAALDVADRQNAHSMTLAVRAIVELFRLVKREQELHRQILAFSISHDHRSVRIYGHYPVIDGSQTTFYRHPIHEFSLTALDGKEKWTAYRFTKNVYDTWMPTHLDRIRSVVGKLPSDFDFEVPLLSEESGLSQDLESHHLSRSFTRPESLPAERGSQSGTVDVGDITPDTSFTGQGASKKPRRNAVNSKR
ncbi:phosphatidylserine decarboxylase [Pyrenophora seminiperda CCB06]|uniref:Phosphatidylserine decarboxylase n=1 Tax=Pyrenophora seminiperda CCB06 TaxID=1302712 RepID=A0A3M7MG12_9PLEO|nr:phosphatidylserine decarboxylase [Pyrenophora seminiperda CCB06]